MEYGPYYRVDSTSQTAADAKKMVESRELWGREPFGSDVPQAQAYTEPKEGRPFLEFWTFVEPRADVAPPEIRWHPNDPLPAARRAGDPGVRLEDGYAKISIRVTRNTFE